MQVRMVCIGPGPGPKNVLAEHPDGSRVVYPYAIWKHRISKLDIEDVHCGPLHQRDQGGTQVDVQAGVVQVAVRTTRNGRQIYDISCTDGKSRVVWEDPLANALNAYAGSGAILTLRVKVTQNGQYTNETITAFAPPGQALPPEQAGGGPVAGGARRGGGGSMSPEDKTRIAKMGAQGSAATIVAALFTGAGPEAYAEAVELHTQLTHKLYKEARSHEKGGDNAGATVLAPGAAVGQAVVGQAAVLPQSGVVATPQGVAAAVPGVVVGTAALPPGGAADAQAAVDVQAQAASEAGDIDWD